MKRLSAVFLIPAFVLGAWALPSAASAAKAKEEERLITERFSGNARVTGIRATGTTAQIEISVQRMTTEEERAELLRILSEKGTRKMNGALRRQDETGWIRTSQSLRWVLRYAREVATENGRQLILATDRPIGFREASRNARSLDYDTTLIILNLDEEGRGDGQMLVGAELKFDEASNTLTVEGASNRPVELVNIRKR
jgi:hypothetical protein